MDAVASLSLQPTWSTRFAAAALLGPEPFSTTQFMRLFPCGLACLSEERFAAAAQQGYLVSDERGRSQATEAARATARQLLGAMVSPVAHLQPMPDEPLRRLVDYLARLADASLAAPEPSNTFIAHKRKYMHPSSEAPLLSRLAQSISELSAYRDDVHIAAWQALGVEGHAWEVLTTLWRDGAATLDGLQDWLESRGVPQDMYAQDLQ
jgi:hypothetical protein